MLAAVGLGSGPSVPYRAGEGGQQGALLVVSRAVPGAAVSPQGKGDVHR